MLAALNNLQPLVTRRVWLVAFGFGLIHGLGFAERAGRRSACRAHALLPSLLGFNLGVELGQLAIVAAVHAGGVRLRQSRLYPRVALQAGSLAIGALGGVWFISRAFDLGPGG